MAYFRCLSFILGALVIFSSLWLIFFVENYKRISQRFLPETRPAWFLLTCVAWLAFVLFTWYRYLLYQTGPAFILAVILSLSLIKCFAILFNYSGFRGWSQTFLDAPNSVIRVLGLMYLALGGALIAIGLAL